MAEKPRTKRAPRKPAAKTQAAKPAGKAAKPATEEVVEAPVEKVTEEVIETPAKEATEEAATVPVEEVAEAPAEEAVETQEDSTEEPEVSEEANSGPELLTSDDVAAYLATPGIEIRDKLDYLAKAAPLQFRTMVGSLQAFQEAFNSDVPETEPAFAVSKIYNLYSSVLKPAIETVDAREFSVKMDIIGLVFMTYGDTGGAFSLASLLRYDYLWIWGEASLKTYQILVTVISSLASRATREEALKKLAVAKAFNVPGLGITSETAERIVRYYTA